MDSPTMNRLEIESNSSAATSPAAKPGVAATTAGVRKTSVHVTALDGIVNVNSLFTLAIFIGFTYTSPKNNTTEIHMECITGVDTLRRLIVFEVSALSSFLFSSLIAQSLKLAINLLNSMDASDPHKADIDPDYLKYGLFGSAIGSVLGIVFLMLSIVDFIQVKLGRYSCGGESVYAVAALLIFVGCGLLVYTTTAIYASFFAEVSTKNDDTKS